MAWKIELSNQAKKNLKQFDPQTAKRILVFLFERVAMLENPRDIGEALQGTRLGECWKYRIGDYRVVAELKDSILCIVVVRIGHRREVYK
jgi:mRNA interferase RelE/StbE